MSSDERVMLLGMFEGELLVKTAVVKIDIESTPGNMSIAEHEYVRAITP